MKRHDTPAPIATALSKWYPNDAKSILEPSVGNGMLLKPLLDKPRFVPESIICIDNDPTVAVGLSTAFEDKWSDTFHFIAHDFLTLDVRSLSQYPQGGFDCAIMNPPFQGKHWFPVAELKLSEIFPKGWSLPMEGAFTLKAVDLLKPSGRLLAVLPTSVISGSAGTQLRNQLLSQGKISYVHELPPKSFDSVEARVYLMVFDKGFSQRKITLLNHDLQTPHTLPLKISDLSDNKRLDFNYYAASAVQRSMLSNYQGGTIQISDLATIKRGAAKSPEGKHTAIHTIDYRDGFWRSNRIEGNSKSEVIATEKDILVARVGRNCLTSLGILRGNSAPITDCVIRIRPYDSSKQTEIMLTLRSLLTHPAMQALLMKGSGAKHVTVTDLQQIRVPLGLTQMYPTIFENYEQALQRDDFQSMRSYENKIQRHIFASATFEC